MDHLHQTSTERRGSVSVMALFVTILVGGLTVALLQVGMSFNREQTRRIDDERALFLAEAGVQESLLAMRQGGTGGIGSQAAPTLFGNGLLWVDALPVGNQLVRLRSIGMCGSGRVALEGLIFHYTDSLVTTALFSNQSFRLESNVFIDSFDSSAGTYAAQLAAGGGVSAGNGAVSQSNGDVVIDSSVEVHGDVHPGIDDTVEVPGSSSISGSLQPGAEVRPMPPVTVPAIAAAGALDVPADGVTLLPSGDYHFTSLHLSSGTLTVEGPARLVLDDVDIDSNTTWVLDTSGGPIEIYGTGDFVLASNSNIVTTDLSARSVTLNLVGGPAQNVELRSNSTFYGTVYSPEGSVTVHSNFEVYGSLAADRLVLNANVRVHFDESLTNPPPGGERYVFTSWSVASLPAGTLSTDRSDPATVLGVDPAALTSPADAHL